MTEQHRLDRPELREKIDDILGFKTCEVTLEPLCRGVQISNSQMCINCQCNQILALIGDIEKAERERIIERIEQNSEYDIISDQSVRIIIEEDLQALKEGK